MKAEKRENDAASVGAANAMPGAATPGAASASTNGAANATPGAATPGAASASLSGAAKPTPPKRTLLHACCGPCTLEPSRLLALEGHELTVYYANPNIHPGQEYEKRLDTLLAWANTQDLPVIEGEYDPSNWDATIAAALRALPGDADDDPAARRRERCRACYRLRFEQAAAYAHEQGFDCLSTTLSVSPYQFTDVICEELERACATWGIQSEFRDFRPHYAEATRRSRVLGMYRQNYCGCRFSDAEAAHEREERAAARRAARELKEAQRAAWEAEHADELAAQRAVRAAARAAKQDYAAKQQRKRAILKQLRDEGRSAEGSADLARRGAEGAAAPGIAPGAAPVAGRAPRSAENSAAPGTAPGAAPVAGRAPRSATSRN